MGNGPTNATDPSGLEENEQWAWYDYIPYRVPLNVVENIYDMLDPGPLEDGPVYDASGRYLPTIRGGISPGSQVMVINDLATARSLYDRGLIDDLDGIEQDISAFSRARAHVAAQPDGRYLYVRQRQLDMQRDAVRGIVGAGLTAPAQAAVLPAMGARVGQVLRLAEFVAPGSVAHSGGRVVVNTTEAVHGTNTIRSSRILGRLKETDTGRLVRENIDNGKIKLVLDGDAFPPKVYGRAFFTEPDKIGGVAKVFVRNTQTRELTFRTAVHEGVHALGVTGSRKAEVLARLAEVRALGRKVRYSDVKRAVLEVDSRPDLYGKLPRRLGIPITNNAIPGTSF